ncbi:nonsense-mediated mRNA decay factor SMG8 isoform X2 [Episyrphus balteatus]|uniref:nonsense-mediated mRNA decay factor SMG8 isoform X2 n=1 Tax=Episyrphus balteatus TaxID=286459 RepID=UPI002484E7AD|nr:nonsense-mediated mRNA decay factor SMG8 isoform X2 [Episyrphus balteatus]
MSYFETWVYPNNPPEACGSLFEDNRKLVLVGIIGKSAFPDCNKMAGLNVMDTHPSHLNHECKEGQIRFYYTDSEDILFLHFQTTFDEFCMRGAMLKEMKNLQSGRHLSFQQYVRNRFARMLLFATQVCHIVVFVELGVSFDASLISIFKSLKLISGTCLFALPGNKRFVYYNTDTKIREDPLLKSLNDLQRSFKTNNYFKEDNMSNMEDLRLFGSFGIPLVQNVDAHFKVETPKRNTFMNFLKDHIKEALQFGFNDGVSKFKSKSNFLVPNVKTCYETFKLLHNIFIDNADNPDYEPADPFYKSYLENFDKLMDIDEGFFSKCCDNGVKKACNLYNNAIIKHCGKSFQKALIDDSLSIYVAHARGPNIDKSEQKLIENFDPCWMKEKQYESLSNRAKNSNITKPNRGNSNNEILASTCSCKRIQCSRRGPYVMGQEIYEFLQTLQDVCRFCVKNKKTELFH